MRSRYLIGNWKMNLPPEGVENYLAALGEFGNGAIGDAAAVNVVVAPPYPYLHAVATQSSIPVAAQNCADHDKGAYTGEVSAAMVHDAGARFVILGHSERRGLYAESDVIVARKLAIAIATGLTPILCIGEELRTRDSGHVATFLAAQLRAAAEAPLDAAESIVLAYEPVWAIGTGRNASGLMVAETLDLIRESLERFWPARHVSAAPILYGGSVTPENVQDLETHGRADGYLVGGACLDSGKLRAIHSRMQRLPAVP